MSGNSFKDQYKHPQWQKKRLEALESAGFECAECGSKDNQLHVHHKSYIKGMKIWEYEIAQLSVLCEGCHSDAHLKIDELKTCLSYLSPHLIGRVLGYVKPLVLEGLFDVASYEEAEGVANHFGVAAELVIDSLDEHGKTSVLAIETSLLNKANESCGKDLV